MSINDVNSETVLPNNVWTQMIEAAAARNRAGTSLTPEQIAAGVPIMGTPLPSARSADLGRATTPRVPTAPMLTPEEIHERNRLALAAGVHPSQIPGFDADAEDMGPYASMEDAIAAGAPVGSDPEDVAIGARAFREAEPLFRGKQAPEVGRMTAREFIAHRAESQLPRLPDFKKIQMIDMVNGKVYVDGLEFTCTPGELKMLRKFCVNKAREQIQASLDAALKALAEDDNDGEAV